MASNKNKLNAEWLVLDLKGHRRGIKKSQKKKPNKAYIPRPASSAVAGTKRVVAG